QKQKSFGAPGSRPREVVEEKDIKQIDVRLFRPNLSLKRFFAVIMMMTADALTREARTWRASSRPSGGGMRISRKTAWNFSLVRSSAASTLLVREIASKPEDRKISELSSDEGA